MRRSRLTMLERVGTKFRKTLWFKCLTYDMFKCFSFCQHKNIKNINSMKTFMSGLVITFYMCYEATLSHRLTHLYKHPSILPCGVYSQIKDLDLYLSWKVWVRAELKKLKFAVSYKKKIACRWLPMSWNLAWSRRERNRKDIAEKWRG